ncbi:MAG: tetratricopeptide repeat protein [Anaerolineae bacterium]
MMQNWRRGEAGIFLERGEALEQTGRLDEAMSEFKRAVHADPGLPEAHMALGYHYRRKGLLSKAAEEFRTAASLAPSYDAFFNLGHVLVDIGLCNDAIAAFRRCLELAPCDAAAGYEIAYAHYVAGDFAAAQAQVAELLRRSPDDWELNYLSGSCELALGHYQEAQAALERALSLIPAQEDDSELREALQVALRHREFRDPKPGDIKARLYAEHGIIYLGTLGDDGLHCSVQARQWLSYQDLGRMLQRFHALRLRWRWRFDSVVAVDDLSTPLALAFARTLQAPLQQTHEVQPGSFSLLVWATVTVPELLTVVAERMVGPYITLAAAMDEAALERVIPDVVGVVCQGPVTLPWDSRMGRGAAVPAAREIVANVKSLPPDDNLSAQVSYYARLHRRLRIFPPLEGRA